MVEGGPLESFEGNGGLCISVLIFFVSVKERGKEGERGRAREIILLWNLDSGAHRPRSQSIWPV